MSTLVTDSEFQVPNASLDNTTATPATVASAAVLNQAVEVAVAACAPAAEAPQISVVIPTHRRPDLLRRCLNALLQQTLAAAQFEIVVVDDGRDEHAHQRLSALLNELSTLADKARKPVLRCLRTRVTVGPAAARNAGWRAARAELIAFTDDDTVPNPDWLQQGLAALRADQQAVALQGAVQVPLPTHEERDPTDHERNTARLQDAGFVTANCFVRRRALEAIGGFDERFTRAWREDTDLYFSLCGIGMVRAAPQARVQHPVREVRWGFSVRSHANLVFDALLYRKHGPLYWRYVRSRPPWSYYVVVLCTLLSPWFFITQHSTLGTLAVITALLLIGRLMQRRLHGSSRRWRDRWEVILTSLAIPFVGVYWRLAGALRWRVLFL